MTSDEAISLLISSLVCVITKPPVFLSDLLLFPPGHIQLKVDSIHSLLRQHIPEDALCLIGLTMMDLFEDETDLFVAGLAAGNQRVAVGINAPNTPE